MRLNPVHTIFFFLMSRPPPRSTLFPYTTLFRSGPPRDRAAVAVQSWHTTVFMARDRKSTRLNSSHQIISYAVFCLKKKKHATTKLCTLVLGRIGAPSSDRRT